MGQFYLVDAFVKPASWSAGSLDHLSGNPAGVCLVDGDKPASWLQAMAAEINQAETAFLQPSGDGSWQLRWFTPTTEVSLCGHATLAAAHVLWQETGSTETPLRFHTLSGELRASQTPRGIQLDFPADQPEAATDSNSALASALGVNPQWLGRGRDDLLVVLESQAQVKSLKPDFGQLAKIQTRGLIVTAPGATTDMASRFFAPAVGIPEDSVTGSAHCLLAVYWGERLGKTQLTAYQASARGGYLELDWQGDRVLLSGRAHTRIQGVYRD